METQMSSKEEKKQVYITLEDKKTKIRRTIDYINRKNQKKLNALQFREEHK